MSGHIFEFNDDEKQDEDIHNGVEYVEKHFENLLERVPLLLDANVCILDVVV